MAPLTKLSTMECWVHLELAYPNHPLTTKATLSIFKVSMLGALQRFRHPFPSDQ
uniref:Uncharacterized protein n=1 Tax=Oryza barthii TaxID=65489 RepID=A0A0D3GHP4_9ORYZ